MDVLGYLLLGVAIAMLFRAWQWRRFRRLAAEYAARETAAGRPLKLLPIAQRHRIGR